MGETGPCGPCSEIHIDRGPEACDKQHLPGHDCSVNQGCARYIELWNLVFIQYDRQADGSLVELKSKHVDTGMGLERVAAVIQKVSSNYDTDLFRRLISFVEQQSGRRYGAREEDDLACGSSPTQPRAQLHDHRRRPRRQRRPRLRAAPHSAPRRAPVRACSALKHPFSTA
jgi:alanyl-tRNA synthetase